MGESVKRHRMRLAAAMAFFATAAIIAPAGAVETVQYTYDELGRLTMTVYPDGKKITYAYDATGNRTQQVVSNNTAPIAGDDWGEVFPDQSVTIVIDVRSNDSDPGDTFSITSFTQGGQGTVSQFSGAALMYTFTGHPFAWVQDDSFSYTITDSFGLTATANVSVTIQCVTSPPGGIC